MSRNPKVAAAQAFVAEVQWELISAELKQALMERGLTDVLSNATVGEPLEKVPDLIEARFEKLLRTGK